MKLFRASQLTIEQVAARRCDAIIAASGYERRAVYIAELLKSKKCLLRTVLGFDDKPRLARRGNDSYFANLKYIARQSRGDGTSAMKVTLENIVERAVGTDLSLVVDYTSMTRNWYASIFEFFRREDLPYKSVTIYFCYSFAKFSAPKPPGPNQYMEPIPGFCEIDLPSRETALIIGLGYERDRGLGLMDYVEAAETYALYADPSIDCRFSETVRRSNAKLLNRIGENRVMRHPVTDLAATYSMLSSLGRGLSERFRVILAPLGPKPFSLLCLLLASQCPGFDVWRVSAGDHAPASERMPDGKVIVCGVQFIRDQAESEAPSIEMPGRMIFTDSL